MGGVFAFCWLDSPRQSPVPQAPFTDPVRRSGPLLGNVWKFEQVRGSKPVCAFIVLIRNRLKRRLDEVAVVQQVIDNKKGYDLFEKSCVDRNPCLAWIETRALRGLKPVLRGSKPVSP
jgi:hypothetical protein